MANPFEARSDDLVCMGNASKRHLVRLFEVSTWVAILYLIVFQGHDLGRLESWLGNGSSKDPRPDRVNHGARWACGNPDQGASFDQRVFNANLVAI